MESSAKNARVVTSKEGLKLEWLGLKQFIKIHSEDTGGAYCVSEEEMPAGMTVPLHVHHRHSETFRIFHGEIEFQDGRPDGGCRSGNACAHTGGGAARDPNCESGEDDDNGFARGLREVLH